MKAFLWTPSITGSTVQNFKLRLSSENSKSPGHLPEKKKKQLRRTEIAAPPVQGGYTSIQVDVCPGIVHMDWFCKCAK